LSNLHRKKWKDLAGNKTLLEEEIPSIHMCQMKQAKTAIRPALQKGNTHGPNLMN
jgi:hypothetical protein